MFETAGGEDGVVSISVHWGSEEDVVADREVSKEGLLVDVGDTLRAGEAEYGGMLSARKEREVSRPGGGRGADGTDVVPLKVHLSKESHHDAGFPSSSRSCQNSLDRDEREAISGTKKVLENEKRRDSRSFPCRT